MTEKIHDPTLPDLLEEMVESKKAIREVLKISPEEVQLHRIFGMYAGQILDIRKVMLQEPLWNLITGMLPFRQKTLWE